MRNEILLFTLLMSLFLPQTSFSIDFTDNGITYYVINGTLLTVEVTHTNNNHYEGHLVIPSTVSSGNKTYTVVGIGDGAFLCQDAITEVTLPNSITYIESRAFYGCTALTHINIGDRLKDIGHYAFQQCEKLTEISLPATTTSIGRACFKDCKSLRHLYINSPHPPTFIHADFIDNYRGIATDQTVVHVPSGCTKEYRETSGWNLFKHIIETEDTNQVLLSIIVEGDGHFAFLDQDSIHTHTFTLPKGTAVIVRAIADKDCHLSSITLNGKEMANTMSGDTLTCGFLYENTILQATFKRRNSYLTLCHNKNGDLQIDINEGQTVKLKINAHDGWRIYSVFLDEKDVTSMVDEENCLIISKAKSGMSIRVLLEKDGEFTIWQSNGLQSSIPITNPLTVPKEAVATDLTDILTPTIIPNQNPNTLYLTDDETSLEESLLERNVVCDGHAQRIQLYDGHDSYIPFDIQADEIVYHHSPLTDISDFGWWETIVLPFAVESTTAIDGTMDLFQLKESKDEYLVFDKASQWEANTPYLISMTPTKDNTLQDMTDQSLDFMATNTILHRTDSLMEEMTNYTFQGTMATTSLENVYTLHAQGDYFEWQSSATIAPFRAYIKDKGVMPFSLTKPIQGDAYVLRQEQMVMENIENAPFLKQEHELYPTQTYHINGIKMVSKVGTRQPGIYLRKGKKTAIK